MSNTKPLLLKIPLGHIVPQHLLCRGTMYHLEGNTMVQFAGVDVEEGDEIHAVYDDAQGYEVEETMIVQKISNTGSGFVPAHLEAEDERKFDVSEERVHDIEVL